MKLDLSKPKLDLSKPNCHVCGNEMVRDLEAGKEHCVNLPCSAREIEFTIPVILEPKK